MKNFLVLFVVCFFLVSTFTNAVYDEESDKQPMPTRYGDNAPDSPTSNDVDNNSNEEMPLTATDVQDGQDQDDATTDEDTDVDMVTSQGNQNENKGSETKSDNRSEVARENMSEVANKVEMLLQTKFMGGEENEQGNEEGSNGIGEQVRVVAQAQKLSQEKVQERFEKVEKRSGIVKFFVGPDQDSIDAIREEVSLNMVRVKMLQKLQFETQNEDEAEMLRSTIIAILDQNTALQDRLAEEQDTFSLFGWMRRLFS
jgi:hypothetical protein